MGIKSQVRVQQLTGSVTQFLPGVTRAAGSTVASAGHADLGDILSYYADALANIHGNREFGAQVPGRIKHESDVLVATTGSGGVGSRSVKIALDTYSGGEDLAKHFISLEQGSGANASFIKITNNDGQGDGGTSGESAINLDATTGGGIAIRANTSKKVYIDGGELESRANSVDILAESDDPAAIVIKSETLSPSEVNSKIHLHNVTSEQSDALRLEADAGGFLMEAALGSKVQLADGVLEMDLNGTDAVDGLLVDAEGTITLQAAHASDGALILHAENAAGNIQHQIQNDIKLAVSGTRVDSYAIFQARDETEASSTTTGGAVVFGGLGVGKDIRAGKDVYVANDTFLVSDAAKLELGSGNELQILHDGLAASSHQVKTDEKLFITGSQGAAVGGGMLILSGANMTVFQGAGLTNVAGESIFSFAGLPSPGLPLTLDGDSTTYQTKFGNTTVLGALNQLFDSVSATEPTMLSQVLTGSVSAGVPKLMGASDIPSGGGTAAKFIDGPMADITPAKIEVYLNGQQLLSGSETARAAGEADYNVNNPGQLRFSFELKPDDVLIIRDRT